MVIAKKIKKTRKKDEIWADDYVGINPHTTGVIYPTPAPQSTTPEVIPKKDMEVERARKIVNDYVNAIIFKNPLENLYEYNHLSDIQRNALEAIQSDELEKKLAIYRNKRDTLAEQIETLTKQVESLTDKKQKQNEALSGIRQELQTARDEITAMQTNEAETLNKLKKEVEALTQKKDELSSIIDGLNESYDKYQKVVMSQMTGLDIVEWEPISFKDPIFKMSSKEARDYIKNMISTYAQFFSIPYDKAQNIFFQHSPVLPAMRTVFESNDDEYVKLKKIHNLAESLYIPKYYKSKEMIMTEPDKRNIETMKREANLQRAALESNAKAQIAEFQVNRLIGALLKYLPPDVDAKQIINNCLSGVGSQVTQTEQLLQDVNGYKI